MADAFQTTQWSIVLTATRDSHVESATALQTLCSNYWYPLYAYIRRRTQDEHQALDLTQSFFLRLLEKETLAAADPERGRFRAFLLTACKRFLANEHERATALKRGGDRRTLSLDLSGAEDRYRIDLADDMTPERLFDKQWAQALINRVLVQLRTSFSEAGDETKFDLMKPFLQGSKGRGYSLLASDLGMSESAAKVAVYRLRKRFRGLLREEIAQTVESAVDIDDEILRLMDALA